MARKRVHALRRGPDGSAFHKCESCGLSVAIALVDMHECEIEKKKLKSYSESGNVKKQRIQDQPRSAFRFFIEEFTKICGDNGNEVEVENRGFKQWKAMSKEDRLPFSRQADKVNSAYEKLLRKEETEIERFEDEADSAEVGKYDERYEDNYDSENSDWFEYSQSDSHLELLPEDSFEEALGFGKPRKLVEVWTRISYPGYSHLDYGEILLQWPRKGQNFDDDDDDDDEFRFILLPEEIIFIFLSLCL
ncbi:hypothetical protein CASFOL_023516 [Castilleja foliolosa]|uniref:HMG box domain-containing protein n=1 Tax=Castilleja foliolosa TaxID=1961234 RepID=A0ABD3CM44_9LAMI